MNAHDLISVAIGAASVLVALIVLVYLVGRELRGPVIAQEVHLWTAHQVRGEELHDAIVRLYHQGFTIEQIVPIEREVTTRITDNVIMHRVTKAIILTQRASK
jgi:hypothetical protein